MSRATPPEPTHSPKPATHEGLSPVVTVAVITYRRPRALRRLMLSLAEIDTDGLGEVRCLVVDNDREGSAEGVVVGMAGAFPVPVRYVLEPMRGIPQARNRAVREATGSDYLAFVDDDEVVTCDWLQRLLAGLQQAGAQVVQGPVLARFESPVPAWMLQGALFDHPRHAHTSLMPSGAAGNTLIDMRVFAEMNRWFDESWPLSGGTDSEFFTRVNKAGCKIVWTDDAVVYEYIPRSRARVSWLLRRALRQGNAEALVMLRHCPGRPTVIRLLRRVVGRLLQGTGALLTRGWRSKANAVRALTRCSSAIGTAMALGGYQYHEYRTTHGT